MSPVHKSPFCCDEEITGAEVMMRCLLHHEADTIFGYPGGAIMPAYDALYDYSDRIRHVLVRHEQGAVHAAEGYARLTGKVGVCIATSGPGATNLVTGIADAMMDSCPLVCITGQVARYFLGTDSFQETDVIGITMPITKWNYQVTSAAEIPDAFAKAFAIAAGGRPGPVVIDITKNAQIEKARFSRKHFLMPRNLGSPRVAEEQIEAAAHLINHAKRPYVLAGHGILISKAQEALTRFAEKAGCPVASTLLGLSGFPTGHPLYAGYLGMHGNYAPNMLTNEADVLIAVGMRFDDRVTGNLAKYAPDAKVIHIDIDEAEINKNVRAAVGVVGDAKTVLEQLMPLIEKREHPAWVEDFKRLEQIEFEQVIQHELKPEGELLRMSEVVHLLSEKTKGEAVTVLDVGQHQMVAARYYRYRKTDGIITSGGLGTMGFSVPAAIGAAMAAKDRPVVAICGDGGFQMTCQELGTISQENLPVKIMILNNNHLGMVRQWQEMFFDKRYSFVELKNPDFVKLSEAFGVPAEKVHSRSDLPHAMERMLTHPGAYLLDIQVEKEGNVFPMMPAGSAVNEIRLR